MHYLLLFYIFQSAHLTVVEFDHMDSCKVAGQALMKEFDDTDEVDDKGQPAHNSFFHCVEK